MLNSLDWPPENTWWPDAELFHAAIRAGADGPDDFELSEKGVVVRSIRSIYQWNRSVMSHIKSKEKTN
jgi:hypothetical protein